MKMHLNPERWYGWVKHITIALDGKAEYIISYDNPILIQNH